MSPVAKVIDLDDPSPVEPVGLGGGLVLAHTRTAEPSGNPVREAWLDAATVTLAAEPSADRRCVHVEDVGAALQALLASVAAHPTAAAVVDDVLRAGAGASTVAGLIIESLAYSTLQSGAEFRRWLQGRLPERHDQSDPVLLERTGSHLEAVFNRPDKHNAFSNALRAGLIDALTVALLDPAVGSVTLRGAGPSFCSGGDLGEFGLLDDPVQAHLARTRHSPAFLIDALTGRLEGRAQAHVHGSVLGSGLEMAAFFGTVVADPGAVFGLPELGLGLIPGAGGTVSVPRRIGRWRTAYLILSGRRIDASTALAWGLIDRIGPSV